MLCNDTKKDKGVALDQSKEQSVKEAMPSKGSAYEAFQVIKKKREGLYRRLAKA